MTEIRILGTGCTKCKRLEKTVIDLCQKNAIAADIAKVDDINQILEYGVMTTPGLVVNGVVKAAGRVPKDKEILAWITAE